MRRAYGVSTASPPTSPARSACAAEEGSGAGERAALYYEVGLRSTSIVAPTLFCPFPPPLLPPLPSPLSARLPARLLTPPTLRPTHPPVTMDSSTCELPSTTSPSAGTRAPGSTFSRSPRCVERGSMQGGTFYTCSEGSRLQLWHQMRLQACLQAVARPQCRQTRDSARVPTAGAAGTAQAAHLDEGRGHLLLAHHPPALVRRAEDGSGGRQLQQLADGLRHGKGG